jgi:enterochelin esterase family protein
VTHRNALAIQELVNNSPDPAKVKAFLSSGRRFPIVEGTSVTFVWFGQADGVTLRHWIFGLESDSALARIPGTDLFHLTFEIPRG